MKKSKHETSARAYEMVALLMKGKSIVYISKRFHVSPARVRQIISVRAGYDFFAICAAERSIRFELLKPKTEKLD